MHYGWLASGERILQLLQEIPDGSKALDVGCGMVENVVALHEMKLDAYGLNMSQHLVRSAITTLRDNHVEATQYGLRKRIRKCDARELTRTFREKFDAVLAVYSMEFFENIEEFRSAIAEICKSMEVGGSFVLCLSHPTTHPDYPDLHNETSMLGHKDSPLLMYSVRDVVQALCDHDLVVERIVEQHTSRPSQMTYGEAKQYPYHFHKGQNPFHTLFDTMNEQNPHTLIYKSRREK